MNKYMTIGELKNIINELPDEMFIVMPVVDEDDVNRIFGFRKIATAGILRCESEAENEREVFCINGASDSQDIADQIHFSGKDVSVVDILYGSSKYGEVKK